MKYFSNINTLEELKKQYKKLAMKYHPDRPNGSEEIMKKINSEYEKMFAMLKDKEEKEAKKEGKQTTSTNEKVNDFIDIINRLININDIEIELIGSWIWLSGNTYPIRELLKELKFRWSSGKKMWYYTIFSANDDGNKRKYKGKQQNMGTIRAKYGSTVIKDGKNSSKNFVPQLT